MVTQLKLKIGKWSLRSCISMPFLVGSKQLVNILSIKVAESRHILVGFLLKDKGLD